MAPTKAPRITVDVDKYRKEANVPVLTLSDQTGIARTSLRRKLTHPGMFTLNELHILFRVLNIPADAYKVIFE